MAGCALARMGADSAGAYSLPDRGPMTWLLLWLTGFLVCGVVGTLRDLRRPPADRWPPGVVLLWATWPIWLVLITIAVARDDW